MIFLSQEELQVSHSAREKELNKQRAVDRVRVRDPANRQRIVSLFYKMKQHNHTYCLLDVLSLLRRRVTNLVLVLHLKPLSVTLFRYHTKPKFAPFT